MGERKGTKGLELWCRRMTEGYPGVNVVNMTTSWRDGLAFCAIIHHFRPDLIEFSKLNKDDIYHNNDLAFRTAERHLGIPALLEPEDMVDFPVPDRLSILTYLSQFYQTFVVSQGKSPTRIPSKRPSTSPEHPMVSPASSSPPTKVAFNGASRIRRDPCAKCNLPVFIAERLNVGKLLYHRTCFRCARCSSQLTLANYYKTEGDDYCCETCPDEEKTLVPSSVLSRSVSDEEKTATLKNETDDYSARFETALEHSRSLQFSKRRSFFIDEPPDLPKTKPPTRASKGEFEDSEECGQSGSFSEAKPLVPVTKETDKRDDSSLVRSRMKLFEAKETRADVVQVPLSDKDSNRIRKDVDSPKEAATNEEEIPVIEISDETLETEDDGEDSQQLSVIEISDEIEEGHSQDDEEIEKPVVEEDAPASKPRTPPPLENSPKRDPPSPLREDPQPTAKRDPQSPLREDPQPTAKRDPQSPLREDPQPTAKRDPQSPLREDPQPTAKRDPQSPLRGDPQSTLREDPQPTAKRDPQSPLREDPQPTTKRDPQPSRRGDFQPTAKRDPQSSLREDAQPTAKRDPQSPLREDPQPTAKTDPRSLLREDLQPTAKTDSQSPLREDPHPLLGQDPQQTAKERSPSPLREEPHPPQPTAKRDSPSPLREELHPPLTEDPHPPLKGSPLEDSDPQTDDYPEDLDPFRDEVPEPSLNPFDDEEDDDPPSDGGPRRKIQPSAEDKELSPLYIQRISVNPFDEPEPPQPLKRKVKAFDVTLNPFWSEDDENQEDDEVKPVPKPRLSKNQEAKPRESGLSLSSLSSGSSAGFTLKKKKPAPRPPTESGASSLTSSPSQSVTHSPRATPKVRKSKKAPLPPTSTPLNGPASFDADFTNIQDDFEQDKILKDEQNRNRQSQNLQSPSSSEASVSLGAPDKSTYGKWKRKKGQAPDRPIPQRRMIKSLPMADIRRELELIEVQQQGLEKQGVRLERMIREKCEGPEANQDESLGPEVEEMILQLFELVNEKNALFRNQATLMYLRRQHKLEEEHADIEYQIRCLMLQPEANKTDLDKAREEELINRLVEVVERRNEIIECLEMDRLREAEEDDGINSQLNLYNLKKEEDKNLGGKETKKEKKKQKKEKKKKGKVDADKDIDESETTPSPVKEKKKTKFSLFGG